MQILLHYHPRSFSLAKVEEVTVVAMVVVERVEAQAHHQRAVQQPLMVPHLPSPAREALAGLASRNLEKHPQQLLHTPMGVESNSP